jgi:hypothetical protein
MTRISVGFLAWIIFVASPALAAAKKDEVAQKEAAKEAWREGNTAYNLGRYDDAIKHYEEAYTLVPDAAFLFNIAQSFRMAGNAEQALYRYRAFLRTAEPDDPNREMAKKLIEDLREEIKRKAEAKPEVATPPPAGPPVTTPPTAPTPAPEPAAAPSPSQPPAVLPAPPAEPASAVPPALPPPPPTVSLTETPPVPEVEPASPFYKKWWFWTGVGAVVVAGTVTAVVLAGRSRGGVCTGADMTCAEVK